MAKAVRRVFRVLPPVGGGRYGWRVEEHGRPTVRHETKAAAVRSARYRARGLHEVQGLLTQLVIHGRDGRIQTEHTYGEDPERRPG